MDVLGRRREAEFPDDFRRAASSRWARA
jgi:hypothetical protein